MLCYLPLPSGTVTAFSFLPTTAALPEFGPSQGPELALTQKVIQDKCFSNISLQQRWLSCFKWTEKSPTFLVYMQENSSTWKRRKKRRGKTISVWLIVGSKKAFMGSAWQKGMAADPSCGMNRAGSEGHF